MPSRKLVATAAGVALLTAGIYAPSAGAAAGDTTATFTLTGGALSIAVPANATLATWSGNAVSGKIGDATTPVTVTDARNSTSGWTVSAYSSDFETDDGGANEVIEDEYVNIRIAAGADVLLETVGALANSGDIFTATAGTDGNDATASGGTRVGGALGSVTPTALGDVLGALGGLLGTDATNVVEYTPTVTVTVPADRVNGLYTGTITQTVL